MAATWVPGSPAGICTPAVYVRRGKQVHLIDGASMVEAAYKLREVDLGSPSSDTLRASQPPRPTAAAQPLDPAYPCSAAATKQEGVHSSVVFIYCFVKYDKNRTISMYMELL